MGTLVLGLKQALVATDRGEVEREALAQYSWPVPVRIAGYVTGIAAVVDTAIVVGTKNIPHLLLSLALGALFIYGFHVLCAPQCKISRTKSQLIIAAQAAIAVTLLLTAFCEGAALLLYMLAVELQFVYPFRRALLGTFLLWVLQVGTIWLGGVKIQNGSLTDAILTSPAGFVFVVAFTRSAVTELVQRYRATTLLDDLNQAHRELQMYAGQVEQLAVAQERNRMAGEIHDTLGHYLTVINVQLETAQKLRERDPERAAAALSTAKQLATECLSEVRRSVAALRPAALELGLPEALAQLIDEMRRASDLAIHLELHDSGMLRPEVEVAVYRVIQEALTNVRKHAHANNVWLTLNWDAAWFVACVRDDGRGFPTSGDGTESFGLQGMRERLAAVGGSLTVNSPPSGGFVVEFRIPRPIRTAPGVPAGRPALERAAAR